MRIPLKAGTTGLLFDGWAKCDQVATIARNVLCYPPFGSLPMQAVSKMEEQIGTALRLIERF
jgi:mRNA-degrading endonuclease toxin of MazEF toxin-antitoxin module